MAAYFIFRRPQARCPLLAQSGHPYALHMSAIGGKADMTFCGLNVPY